MSRPEISVVMPFAGTRAAALEAIAALCSLEVRPGDELILVDNSGSSAVPPIGAEVKVITAPGERSPAHARNVGAAASTKDWILFLDADTRPPRALLDALWAEEIGDDVGAVAGEIVPAEGSATVVGRYGSARSFLGQRAHHEHPYRPRAAAANLLVRRAAFEELGGFYEGLRAAEDTDFTWRLQAAGWRLVLRSQAAVEHRYRTTLRELRRQWRGYAAGRAWLARRYDGFVPEPAVRRGIRRLRGGRGLRGRPETAGTHASRGPAAGRRDRGRFLALDLLLSLDELAGFGLSNRPPRAPRAARPPASVVLVADRFPAREDPLVELAESLERPRVEAVARPAAVDLAAARRLTVDYLEDDGALARVTATLILAAAHPWRVLRDAARRGDRDLPLRLLAPAARRLGRDAEAKLHALGGERSAAIAARLGRLVGRPLD